MAIQSGPDALEKKVRRLEQTLAQTRAKEKAYRLLYDNAPDMFISVSVDTGNIVQCNQTAARKLGYRKAALIGIPIFDLYHASCRDIAKKTFAKFRQTGHVNNVELEMQRRDGSSFAVSLNVSAIRDDSGAMVHSCSVLRDISEKKRIEARLNRKNRALRTIVGCLRAVVSAENEIRLLKEICAIIVGVDGYRMAWVGYLQDDPAKTVKPVAQAGFEDGYLETVRITYADDRHGRGPTGTAARTGKPALSRNITVDPNFVAWRDEAEKRGYASSVALPLTMHASVFGTLNIYSAHPDAFDDEELALLMELADGLAFGIASIRVRQKRILAEQALRENQFLLKETQQITKVGGWEYRVQTRQLFWTDEVYRIHGLRQDQFNPNDIAQNITFYAPGDRETISRAFNQAVRFGTPYDLELGLIRADGRKIWVRTSARAVRKNGQIVRVFGNIMDITALKEASIALRKSEQRFRRALGNIPASVAIYDPELRIQYINEAARRITGRPRSSFLGKRDDEIWPPDVFEAYLPTLKESLKTRSIQSIYTEIQLPDAVGVRNFFITCIPLFDDAGNVEEIMGITQDFTERSRSQKEIRQLNRSLQQHMENLESQVTLRTKEAMQAKDRAEAADRLKSIFIASMSHELRTPLNSIIGFTGVLLQELSGPLNPEQTDHLSRVYRAGKHLLILINDVIDVSKIEAGKLDAHAAPFDLSKVIDEALSILKSDMTGKNLALNLTLPPGPISMHTDRRRVLQCLLNCLSNAIKYTDTGGISLRVTVSKQNVEIAIADTGVGIRDEDLNRIFESFVRLDSPHKTIIPGTGLGLYLTQKIVVDILGGNITVQSHYGRGSCFTLTIPLRLSTMDMPGNRRKS